MLRHQAAENSVITSSAAKKVLFSSRDNRPFSKMAAENLNTLE